MKTIKNILIGTFAFTSLLFASCSNDDDSNQTLIEANALPTIAQDFVATHFNGSTYRRIKMQDTPDADGSVYEVYLSNGFEIEFDATGNWLDIDGRNIAIPAAIIPEPINNHVNENHPNLFITTIEIKPIGYQVELSNDLDLVFTSEGEFVQFDN